MPPVLPSMPDSLLGPIALEHLRSVVAIESASDEDSTTIPSTPGQARLAAYLGAFFGGLGATVEYDAHGSVIASFAGRGGFEDAEALALMVHLDTARGTRPLTSLEVAPDWDGSALRWPDNPGIRVDVQTYPSLRAYLGQDVVHGTGAAPFGLDDKLGLTHLMTLARLLREEPELPHRPLLLIGRPDEEIGRMEALEDLAALLAARGVRSGFTVDGLDPFEVNVENFNAAGATLVFASEGAALEGRELVAVRLCGVNTHGATAHAEGHRAATRFAAELQEALPDSVGIFGFRSDPQRECDADLLFACAGEDAPTLLTEALDRVVAAHRDRGAGWERIQRPADLRPDGSVSAMLRTVSRFLGSEPGFTLLAEESHGHDGYSHPFRAMPTEGGTRLDIRLRDFSPEGLARRIEHVQQLGSEGVSVSVEHQYVNMGPRLVDRPELLAWAREAGAALGREVPVQPIRGGTGVDPFLDAGVAVANLGTGYFAPESEKELTSVQMLTAHARWLVAVVQSR